MKTLLNKIGLLIGGLVVLVACADFDELNQDPRAANSDQVQVEYFINNSIIGAQQDPHVAERAFVLYWKAASRQDRTNALPIGSYNDGWSADYFRYVSEWLNHANTAIQVAQEKMETGNITPYTDNLMQVARIWRVYLMSEMTDNFGPIPIDAFQGTNPDFASVQEVYYYMLSELDAAQEALDLEVSVPANTQGLDPAYGFDFGKWKKYANSMRMRLAMRLSEVDPDKAREEFEDAVAIGYIETMDDAFAVQEQPGWDPLSGVMSRSWNAQFLSATLNNLYIGLGGISTEEQLPASYHQYVKPEDYIGVRYLEHFTTTTNDPSAGYWMDGLQAEIDPRAYEAFAIPGDVSNPQFFGGTATKRRLLNDNSELLDSIQAAFTWNASALGSWGDKGAKNELYASSSSIPIMVREFRTSESTRIFFGPWESYFLIAEAAIRGWATGMDAATAYENGVSASFDYWGLSNFTGTYLASEEYNRTGTSVSWNHTEEPPQTHTMNYVDGYTGQAGTVEIPYPDNMLYLNGTVKNDHLTKIITQKFIAQFPWLPLEAWSDHRRLGLPFFENPAVEEPLPALPALNKNNFMDSRVEFFPQRLPYPSSVRNSDAEGYQQALNHLGGPDAVFTPLWWAKQQ